MIQEIIGKRAIIRWDLRKSPNLVDNTRHVKTESACLLDPFSPAVYQPADDAMCTWPSLGCTDRLQEAVCEPRDPLLRDK